MDTGTFSAHFTAPLDIRDLGDGKNWQVRMPFTYVDYPTGEYVEVPFEFVTDLASIPRGARLLVPKHGVYTQAAVVHDRVYRLGYVLMFDPQTGIHKVAVTRKQADQLFGRAMKVLGTRKRRRLLIYTGVRVGGWWTWNKYRKRVNGKNRTTGKTT